MCVERFGALFIFGGAIYAEIMHLYLMGGSLAVKGYAGDLGVILGSGVSGG